MHDKWININTFCNFTFNRYTKRSKGKHPTDSRKPTTGITSIGHRHGWFLDVFLSLYFSLLESLSSSFSFLPFSFLSFPLLSSKLVMFLVTTFWNSNTRRILISHFHLCWGRTNKKFRSCFYREQKRKKRPFRSKKSSHAKKNVPVTDWFVPSAKVRKTV